MNRQTHNFIVSIRFDKPCTKTVALREAQDTIFGKNYCTQYNDNEPGEYSIRFVKHQDA